MDVNVIVECKSASLENSITFPEVVQKMLAAGVERYIVDLVSRQCHYYGVDNEYYHLALGFDPGTVALTFNSVEVQKSLKDIQQQVLDYKNFLSRIAVSGCSHYEAFLTGKKVIYTGRDGNQHIELFPSQK